MKFYLIKLNKHSYDQYDSFVVVANNKKEVYDLILETESHWCAPEVDFSGGYTIRVLSLENYKRPEIVLGSFNAG